MRGRLSAGLLAGAAVLLIDAAILIGPSAVRDPYGEGSPYVAFPMAIALFGSAGAVPGLLGALVRAGVNGLLHHADGSRSA